MVERDAWTSIVSVASAVRWCQTSEHERSGCSDVCSDDRAALALRAAAARAEAEDSLTVQRFGVYG
ncbi:hypothetical protein ACFVX3_31365 [Rhodococcus erythropolis]